MVLAVKRTSVAIVGGGIAGLYAAWLLSEDTQCEIMVLEAGNRFGGRIETENMAGFSAEFGPMRFEPTIQRRLDELRRQLDLGFVDFPPTSDDEASVVTASDRYNLRYDEIRHTSDDGSDRPVPPRPFDLLRLGVLRLFRDELEALFPDQELDLCADTVAAPPGRDDRRGKPDFAVRVVIQGWIEHLDDDAFDELRLGVKHRGIALWKQGFWNAISKELSPSAILYLRNEGTFYHLLPDNPNAAEWAIFWLRYFKNDSLHLKTFELGTASLVMTLCARLEARPNVVLRSSVEVTVVEPAVDPTAVHIRARDRRSGDECDVEVDHCILALPLAPLRRLDAHFPQQIRDDLSFVLGFPLLKCFLATSRPWWRVGTPTHAGASAVPTRELHYWGGIADPRGGLVMLYTDHPATEYWKEYVETTFHDRAEMNRSEELKSALVRFLLVYAQRQAERRLGELLRNRISGANGKHDDATVQEFTDELEKALADSSAAELRSIVKQAYEVLVGPPREVVSYEHLERVLDVIRNPSKRLQTACDAHREQVRRELEQALRDRSSSGSAIRPEFADYLKWIVEGSYQPIDERIAERTKSITAFGIRDWARWPVGAGCHTWLCGARSPEIRDRLEAFGLLGRATQRDLKNMHICGEAVSDYQGFIEGALRSAARAVQAIRNS